MKLLNSTLFALMLCLSLSCSKDPCKDIVCVNGGTCVNGTCDCPEGYTGADCSKQQTLDKINITNVRVTRFPTYDNGSNWDVGDGPDITFQIFKGQTLIYSHPYFIEDADPSNYYNFDPDSHIALTDPTDEYVIQLMDYDDFDDDDFMGGISFTPYNNTNSFPSTLTLDAGGNVAFVLDIEYIF